MWFENKYCCFFNQVVNKNSCFFNCDTILYTFENLKIDFKTIEKGKIALFKESKCEYPVVELHEISHVFGFDHIDNKKSSSINNQFLLNSNI